jgi:hypothetical protein
MMRLSHVRMAGLVVASVAACAGIALADPPPNVQLDMPGILGTKKKPGPPEVKAQPLAWPRLDPGAVLCRTEADLARLSARRGGDNTAGPADCRIVAIATAVTIVARKGPGRTQVQVGGSADTTGWTDVWLPEKAPAKPGVVPASQR